MINQSLYPDRFRFEGMTTVGPDSIDAYRELRLRGLHEHPESFGETPTNFLAKSDELILQRLEAQRKLGGFMLIAKSKTGELIGTVSLTINDDEKMRHRGYLWGMYVVPEARNQGIAQALIHELLMRSQQVHALEQIHLAVATTNRSACRLYEKTGFVIYGTDPRAIKIGDQTFDEYLMVKHMPRATPV